MQCAECGTEIVTGDALEIGGLATHRDPRDCIKALHAEVEAQRQVAIDLAELNFNLAKEGPNARYVYDLKQDNTRLRAVLQQINDWCWTDDGAHALPTEPPWAEAMRDALQRQ